jgi:hypothetical protein
LDLRGRKWWEAGEDCIMRSFITCTLHQTVLRDYINENEIGGACRRHGMRNAYKNFGRKKLKGRDLLEDLGIGRKIILELVLRK